MEPKDIVRTGYDALSYSYRQDDDTSASHASARWANLLVGILRPIKGARVLDLGCGCGIPVARTLAQAGHHVVGVDISAVQVKRAKELVAGGQFFRADITELVTGSVEEEVKNAIQSSVPFDAVVAFYVLIHMPVEEQRALIQHLGNWVKAGGYCMMTVGLTAWTGEAKGWLGSDTRMWWSQTSLDNYRKWAKDGGFEISRDEHEPDVYEDSEGHQFLLLKKCM
ncbi:S-adenosyl-L-methionine-dependent methyltransferase [Imleria badia]|nr:S-adenosyl-L-methionine-dependent methyltransferase [Imleria badia]